MKTTVLQGRVIRGEGWARKIGYPTANLDRRSFRYPPLPSGVYVGRARVGKKNFGCLVIIGVPFVRHKHRGHKVEVHLLDFQGNLVGRVLSTQVIRRLRPIAAFPNLGALVTQIERDLRAAEKILRTHGRH